MEEVERQLLATKSWKALGKDGLLVIVLSLISFDIKGAYNRREGYRRSCSGGSKRSARSEQRLSRSIGKHLRPKASYRLVCLRIDGQGGVIASVDNFTAWVTGPTAQSNRHGIETIVNKALDWERRSRATFEAEKTAIIYFTLKAHKLDSEPFTIKGETVKPRDHVKVLGVIMDTRLKYKEYIARAASKGLEAVIELRRLRGLSPTIARQLFTSTVAPVIDYASNVWRSGSGGSHRYGATPALETSCEDVDRHIYPASNQSPPQEYCLDQEIQKIPLFAIVSGRRHAEKH
ncbi:hypothetical protein N7501_007972 [Penicillium viridicatum]|nr:hypothetical protein N7501_007972 [Penicillium viridicatum]